MFVDSHAHLTFGDTFHQIHAILSRAKAADIGLIINICTDIETLERGIELKKEYPWIHNVGATTPHDVEKEGEKFFSRFEEAARAGQLVAIGETGLDYYYEHSNRVLQQKFLRRYLQLAIESNLPVVIHCREAFSDLFAIVDEMGTMEEKLVLHCFTGNLEEAKKALDRGWYISLSGIITFKKSEELRNVAKQIPLENLLIETDAPYLAPQSKRGKPNEPSFLVETAMCLAEIKNIEVDTIAKQTAENTCKLFSL